MAGPAAPAGSPSAGLRFLTGLAAAAAPALAQPAYAAAWIAPEHGQEIVTTGVGQRADGVSVVESEIYLEEPISRRASWVVQPRFENAADLPDGWRGEASVGVKAQLLRRRDAVMAVQAAALWRSEPDPGCGAGGGELRGLGGRSSRDGTRFVNIEAAYQLYEGGCGRRRAEISAGVRPRERWMGLGQAFVDETDGEATVRAQVSVVRFGRDDRGVQVGLRLRVDGSEREPMLVVGLWRRARS